MGRTYDSARDYPGYFGLGWKSTITASAWYTIGWFVPPSTYGRGLVIDNPDGTQWVFVENADGRTYTPPTGRFDTLIKNADGTWDLTPQRTRSRFHFNTSGALTSRTDDYGNTINIIYDGSGRLQRLADASGSGRYMDVSFGANGLISIVRDSTGRQVEYYYSNGALSTVIDPEGRRTNYTYAVGSYGALLTQATDHWGRVTFSATYWRGRVTRFIEDGETYNMGYDAPAGHTVKDDSYGNRWHFYYQGSGVVTDRYLPNGYRTHTDYYADGNVQQITDEVGIKTFFTYGAQGELASVTRDYQGPTAVRFDYAYDPTFAGRVASITPRNPANGQVDANWQGWRYDYHPIGSPAPGALFHTYRKKSDGTEEPVGTYEYNTRGQVTRFTNARGSVTDYGYDASGNLRTLTGPANNDGGTRPITTYTPDALGRVLSVADPLSQTTSFTYDRLNRILSVTLPKPTAGSPLNFVTTYSYDRDPSGDVVFTHITDPNGKVSRLGYDQFGRLASSIDALGNETTYTYSRGLLASLQDANRNVTSYTYDVNRRLKETEFPDGSLESYLYHVDGLLSQKTDQKNQIIQYTYDAHKRLKTEVFPLGTVTYSYTGQKLTQVSDTLASPPETHTFGYDTSYRVNANTQATRGSLVYTYHQDDTVATYSIASGPSATYAYYPDGSLNTIAWSPIAGQFKYGYDLAGRYQTITFPNGQSRNFAHDQQGRLTQIANLHPGAGNLATYAYSYDRDHAAGTDTMLGQRTGMTATVPSQGLAGVQTKYYYDATYRLTRADYPNVPPFNGEVHSWTYDGIGNRLTNTVGSTTAAYSYQRAGTNLLNWQRLLSDGQSSYTYDPNGNTQTKTTPTGALNFTWDIEDRLAGISGLSTASYDYDYQGRRAGKTAGTTTEFLYDGSNLVAEQPGLAATYLFGSGIDRPLAMNRGGAISYLAADGLGSVTAVINPGGAVQNTYLYDAWGVTRAQTGSGANRFGYTGREFGEAGTLFYRARYYQPEVGRFASEDPIRFDESTNFYAYVRNRAVDRIDPSGLLTLPIVGWVDAGENEGAAALDYYAEVLADPSASIGTKLLATAGGLFAALWTPCTSDITFAVLSTGRGMRFGIRTPYGFARQEFTREARGLRHAVDGGAPIYRTGKFGFQETASGQFWAGQNPATTAGFANRYGMSGSGNQWIMQGTVRPGQEFVTRGAPALGANPGGAAEVVVNPGAVRLNWFHIR